MNKNSPIAKFTYCYKKNLIGIKASFEDIKDAFIDDFLPGLWEMGKAIGLLLVRVISIFVPLWQIYVIFNVEYLTKVELEKKYDYHSNYFKDDYYIKLSKGDYRK